MLALAMSSTVFLGFWFTYFSPLLHGAYPPVSPAVHLHGISFLAWHVLFPLQAALAFVRRLRLHRTLGVASVALAAVMASTGLIVIGARMAEALASPDPSFWSQFGAMIFSTLVLFAGFYVAAIVQRSKPAYHKRFLVVATAAGMGAAVFRVLMVVFGPASWSAPVGILATNLFILLGMVHDLRRDGHVHRAYLIGLPTCVVIELGVLLLTPTAVGQAASQGLAWTGQALAFLY